MYRHTHLVLILQRRLNGISNWPLHSWAFKPKAEPALPKYTPWRETNCTAVFSQFKQLVINRAVLQSNSSLRGNVPVTCNDSSFSINHSIIQSVAAGDATYVCGQLVIAATRRLDSDEMIDRTDESQEESEGWERWEVYGSKESGSPAAWNHQILPESVKTCSAMQNVSGN